MATPGDGYLGSIEIWAMNWAPVGFAVCNGQLLPISQYNAMFALLGTYFGGNGQTNFGLPDLCGRVPIGFGQSQQPVNPPLTNHAFAEKGGTEANTLTLSQMPSHNHTAVMTAPTYTAAISGGAVTPKAKTGPGTLVTSPAGAVSGTSTTNLYSTTSNASMLPADVTLTIAVTNAQNGTVTVGPNGSNYPVNNMMPYLAINYIIQMEGIFPSRP
jgi:microcystin-dependent protein